MNYGIIRDEQLWLKRYKDKKKEGRKKKNTLMEERGKQKQQIRVIPILLTR